MTPEDINVIAIWHDIDTKENKIEGWRIKLQMMDGKEETMFVEGHELHEVFRAILKKVK